MANGNGARRTTHIERIYKKDVNGHDDKDVWVDVEMLDEIVQDSAGQRTVRSFKCDPKNQSMRKSSIIKVVNAENDDDKIELVIWDDYQATDVHRTFKNCKSNTERQDKVKKIHHRKIDDEFLDDNGQPPRDVKEYNDAILKTNVSDKNQYVHMDVIVVFKEIGTGRTDYRDPDASSPVIGQGTNHHIKTCESKALPNDDGSGSSGQDEPVDPDKIVRMDPLQWIINVSWGGLAVDFGDKADDSQFQGAGRQPQ